MGVQRNALTNFMLSAALMLSAKSVAPDAPSSLDYPLFNNEKAIPYGPISPDEYEARKFAEMELERKADSTYFVDLTNAELEKNYALRKAMNSSRFSAMVADDEGNVVWEKNADKQRVPASLSKLMTLYRVLEEIENCNLNWDDEVKVSYKAATQFTSNSLMNTHRPKTGQKRTVAYLTEIMMSVSDNTATMALAEHIGEGSEWRFVQTMNKKAEELGMTKTEFTDPSGLEGNLSSPKDIYKLNQALLNDFPQHKKWMCIATHTPDDLKRWEKPIDNRAIDYIDEDTDIVKTGYLYRCKYNIDVVKTVDKDVLNNTEKKYTIVVFGDQKGRPVTAELIENLDALKRKKQRDRDATLAPLMMTKPISIPTVAPQAKLYTLKTPALN